MKETVPPSTVGAPMASVAALRLIRPLLARVVAEAVPLLMAIVPVFVSAA